MRKNWVIAAALAGLLAGIQWTKADTAFTLDNNVAPQGGIGNGQFTAGFQFTVASTISVNAIGVFDDSQNGLSDRYEAGIWNSDGVQVASATIDDGTIDPLVNQFRYKSITPVVLGPGTYDIGALYLTADDGVLFQGDAINFATSPLITFVHNSFAAGDSLADPISTAGNDPAYFGPNFLFTAREVTNPVPLPSSAAAGMALLGVLGLGTVIRRRSAVKV